MDSLGARRQRVLLRLVVLVVAKRHIAYYLYFCLWLLARTSSRLPNLCQARHGAHDLSRRRPASAVMMTSTRRSRRFIFSRTRRRDSNDFHEFHHISPQRVLFDLEKNIHAFRSVRTCARICVALIHNSLVMIRSQPGGLLMISSAENTPILIIFPFSPHALISPVKNSTANAHHHVKQRLSSSELSGCSAPGDGGLCNCLASSVSARIRVDL